VRKIDKSEFTENLIIKMDRKKSISGENVEMAPVQDNTVSELNLDPYFSVETKKRYL